MRVLRLHHSAVVDEYRHRERILRERYGHDVHIVCPPSWPEGGRLVRPGPDPKVPVHIVEVRGRQHPNLFWYRSSALRGILREVRPQIVDLHEEPYSLAVAGALHAVRREAPRARICMYTAQNLTRRYPPPFPWLERRALSRTAAAYPCSTEAGQRLRANGFTGSLHVLALGVSTPEPGVRSPGPLRIGFIGRLEAYKGGLIAVRAFAQASAGTDASLEVIGAGPDLAPMRREVAAAQLVDRVAFTGALSQDQALERIARMDVVLVPSLTTPSWKEQFGRVAAQAMAAGAVVVASDSGALREVVQDCGVLVAEGDVCAFANELSRLMNESARRAELSRRGRERAIRSFSWEAVARGVDAMYRDAALS